MPEPYAGSSPAESSTKSPDGSSDATANAQQNAPTTNSLHTPQDFNPGELTPRDQATLELIGSKLVEGYSEKELAKELGVEHSWVSERLHEVRTAIGLQQGIFPPLSDDEREALRWSIDEYGVLHPVIIDENIRIIDGYNRMELAHQVGRQDTIQYILKRGLTTEQKEDLSFTLNASRRQLDTATRRKLVEYQLERSAARSNQVIASLCGVSAPTVQAVRNDLTAQHSVRVSPDEIRAAALELEPQLATAGNPTPKIPVVEPDVKYDPPVRLSSDGRVMVTKTLRAPKPASTNASSTPLYECPACGTHLHVFGSNGNYRLELQPETTGATQST